jgi:hypothetical protein
MFEPILELTSPLVWNVAFRQDLQSVNEEPIPRKSFLCPSNLLLIGCSSILAKPNWWLGCRLSINLMLGSVDSTSTFTGVTEIYRANIGLRQLKLLHWRAYQPRPYNVLLYIPVWLKQLSVEAYWYDGTESSSYEELLKGIDNRTIAIEQGINTIANNQTDSSTDSGNDMGTIL